MKFQPYNYKFHDPKVEQMALVAVDLDSVMALTFLTVAVATAMVAAMTTTGLFMGINSATPGNTGASELVHGTDYTNVSGGRPPIAWAAYSSAAQVSNNTQTFAMLTLQSGGIPYFTIWTANTAGTVITAGPTTGLSGSIPIGANVTFTSAVTLAISG